MSLVPWPALAGSEARPADELSRPAPLTVLRGHDSQVQAVAFSPDEMILYTGDLTGELRVWDLASGLPTLARKLDGHEGGILSLHLLTRSEGGAWGVDGGIAEGGASGVDGDVAEERLGNVGAAPTLLITHARGGTHAFWALDAAGLPGSRASRTFTHESHTFCRASLLAGDAVSCGTGPSRPPLYAFAAEGGKAAGVMRLDTGVVVCVARLPPSESEARGAVTSLALARGAGGDTPERAPQMRGGEGAGGPGGRRSYVLIGYESGVVDAWEVDEELPARAAAAGHLGRAAGRGGDPPVPRRTPPLRVLTKEPVLGLAASAGGRSCAAVGAAARGAAFSLDADADPPRLRGARPIRFPRQGANDVAIRSDGRVAVLGCWDGTARAVDLTARTEAEGGRDASSVWLPTVAKLKYHSDQIMAIAYSPSGSLLATASGDRTVALWAASRDGGAARLVLGAA